MSEALDRTRILNVAVAEQPVTPSLPSTSPWPMLLGGIFFAALVSIGAVALQEYLDPSFRTHMEVVSELNIPVLAAVPHGTNRSGRNGNGNGNGLAKEYEYSISDSNPVSHLDRA